MHISLSAEPLFYIASFPVTNSFFVSLVVSFLLIQIALVFSLTYKSVPGRWQILFESVVGAIDDLAQSVGGPNTRKFLPLILTLFFFVLFSNWVGLLPGFGSIGFKELVDGKEKFIPLLRGATADLNTTLALALISFFMIQYYGFSSQKLGYLKKFINLSSPIMFFSGLLELISEFSKIISFSFRLFGNVFAGEVLLAVISSLIPVLVSFPFYGLELFVGLIQALVFSILTLVFINMTTIIHGEEVSHGN